MRFVLFFMALAAGAVGFGYTLLGTTAVSSVLGAIWLLIAVVAFVGSAVLDALQARARAFSEPSREPGDRGGAQMPSWLK